MNYSKTKEVKLRNLGVAKILLGTKVLWEKIKFVNQIPLSINADGTIYNGKGYKEDYRIRSGGLEVAQSSACCTGFIPLKNGDTLRIYPAFIGNNTDNAINFADSSFTNIGQITDSGSGYGICEGKVSTYKTSVVGGVSTLTLGSKHDGRIAYVRVTNFTKNVPAKDFIISVNQEIEL